MFLVRAPAPVELRPVAINEPALNATLYYAADLPYTVLDIGLSSALFGTSPHRLVSGRVDGSYGDRHLDVARNPGADVPGVNACTSSSV